MVADPLGLQSILNSPKFGWAPILDNMASLPFWRKECYHGEWKRAPSAPFCAEPVRNYELVFKRVAEKIVGQLEGSPAATDVCSVLSPATLDAISEAILGLPTQDLGEIFVANNIEIVETLSSSRPGCIYYLSQGKIQAVEAPFELELLLLAPASESQFRVIIKPNHLREEDSVA
ncbi:hypothetical protein B0H16DRAFT_1686643 [Mycena metata]|uniref:Uncharacterized protein n=1 Tax=Mycena metata TaxID=1033252 RepID=A0AAD7JPG0_9AGAR|nr:hypothetical protein B0H16DRAFT_1686643 [Mycena metata]